MSVLNNFFPRLWQPSKISLFLGLSILWGLLGEVRSPLIAQVIPDNTLPNNSAVTSQEGVTEITGGTVAGENLFHSFEQFSILTGNTAFFNNADNIANIISRVTGGSISNIDGLLRANGTANFFLLNPNGIVFGENAALNIGGSFISSTANSLQFADGSEFSAVDPQASPLLTVNIPVGLQYGVDPGEIEVTGSGNNLSIDPDNFATVRENRPEGLRVEPKQTLALIGGDISLEGGNLTAEGGNIEVGSVGSNELVSFTPVELGWEFAYEGIASFQDIGLRQAASIDASGDGGGNIHLQGRSIQLRDGSAILANTLGNSAGGNLTIKGTERVEIIGTTADDSFFSGLFADVAPEATGNGGNLTLDTQSLLVSEGAQLVVNTFGDGDAGTLKVQAREIKLAGESPSTGSGFFSNVETDVTGKAGNGGDLTVKTELLEITDGAQISASTFGIGDTGVINVTANEIRVTGESKIVDNVPSGLFSDVIEGATGNSGDLNINTNFLSISDGANISAATAGKGDAGNISIRPREVELKSPSGNALSANAEPGASEGGNLTTVESSHLSITDGGLISAQTQGEGNAGSLTIETQELEINGIGSRPTDLAVSVQPEATGSGGNLTIDTGNLLVTEGGQISASTGGTGDAGELVINATESVKLIGFSEDGASGLFANAIIDTGNGGDIEVNTPRLTIENGATINASNFSSSNPNNPPGKGQAGNITINADSLVLDSTTASELSSITAATSEAGGSNIDLVIQDSLTVNNSQITAETRGSSDGGEISIETDFLGLTNQGEISANSSSTGNASNINIDTDRLQADNGQITATSESSGGGDIDIEGNFISLDNQSVLSTSVANSSGGGGDISINSDFFIVSNNSEISANAVLGAGGNIDIATQGLFLDGDSQITASSEFGIDGEVNIETTENRNGIVRLPELIRDQSEQITTGCAVNRGNLFVSIGKGGIPENPSDYLAGETFWTDLRPLNRQIPKNTKRNYQSGEMPTPIVEAQNWIVNDRGQVQLIANASAQTPWKNTFECK